MQSKCGLLILVTETLKGGFDCINTPNFEKASEKRRVLFHSTNLCRAITDNFLRTFFKHEVVSLSFLLDKFYTILFTPVQEVYVPRKSKCLAILVIVTLLIKSK